MFLETDRVGMLRDLFRTMLNISDRSFYAKIVNSLCALIISEEYLHQRYLIGSYIGFCLQMSKVTRFTDHIADQKIMTNFLRIKI